MLIYWVTIFAYNWILLGTIVEYRKKNGEHYDLSFKREKGAMSSK